MVSRPFDFPSQLMSMEIIITLGYFIDGPLQSSKFDRQILKPIHSERQITFDMGRNLEAVYDVILNFTTQPKNRYFAWHDSQHLLFLYLELSNK
jgi:hypothetical protein